MVMRRLLVAAAATALALTAGGCGSGDTPAKVPAAAGTFVAEVADPAVSVAVVARPAEAGAEREIRAIVYGEAGNGIEEQFTGAAAGNDYDLTAESGATLKGSITADAATGTIVLADRTSIEFRAAPATGAAGWYSIARLGDTVTGTSLAGEGGTLEGRFTPTLAGPGMYTLTGTVRPATGSPMPFESPFLIPATPLPLEQAQVAVIVSQDGTVRGGAKQRKTGSGGSGFTDLLID